MDKKIICCIGDSLTAGDYGVFNMSGIANVQEKGYPYFLKELTHAEVKNYGYCGARSTDILNVMNKGLIDLKDSDIIIIMLGTNGGQTSQGNSKDDLAFISIVNKCRLDSKKARIVLVTPPHATTDKNKSNYGYYNNVKSAAEFISNFASVNGYQLIDLFNDNHFNSDNEDIMQPNDGLHFSEIGYKTMAEIIYSSIKDLLF